MADPFAGRITLFRVVSGVLKSDATVHNVTRDMPERFGHVLVARRARPRRTCRSCTPATSAPSPS